MLHRIAHLAVEVAGLIRGASEKGLAVVPGLATRPWLALVADLALQATTGHTSAEWVAKGVDALKARIAASDAVGALGPTILRVVQSAQARDIIARYAVDIDADMGDDTDAQYLRRVVEYIPRDITLATWAERVGSEFHRKPFDVITDRLANSHN